MNRLMKSSTKTRNQESKIHTVETPPLVSRHLPEQLAYLDLLCAIFETPLVNLVDSLPQAGRQKTQHAA